MVSLELSAIITYFAAVEEAFLACRSCIDAGNSAQYLAATIAPGGQDPETVHNSPHSLWGSNCLMCCRPPSLHALPSRRHFGRALNR